GLAAFVAAAFGSAGAGCPRDVGPGGLAPRGPAGRPAPGVEGPFRVTFASPKGATAAPAEIAVGFSKPMVPLDRAGAADTTPLLRIEPRVAGEYRWLGSQVLTFVPAEPLPLSSSFTATVSAGTKALDGSELAEAHAWTFETPRLRVARSDPDDGERWMKPDSPVDLRFNQPVAVEEIERKATFTAVGEDGDETIVRARVRLGRVRGRAEPEPGVLPPRDEGEIDPRHIVVEPASPLPLDSDVTLTLPADVRAVQGDLPVGEAWTLSYRTYGPFRVERAYCPRTPCRPDHGFEIDFSNPARWDDIVSRVRISPQVALPERNRRDEEETSYFWVGSRLRPETTYTVTIAPGLRDRFGQELTGETTFRIEVGSYPPSARLDMDGTVLEAEGPRVIPARFRNVDQATLRLRALTDEEAVRAAFYRLRLSSLLIGAGTSAPPAHPVVRQVRPGIPRNVERVVPLDLDPGLGPRKRGIVAIGLGWQSEYRPTDEIRIVRVTDLGLTTKHWPGGILAWVTSLRTGRPIAQAEVSVYDREARRVWEGQTGPDGLALVPAEKVAARQRYHESFVVFAKKDGDRTYAVTGTAWTLDPWAYGVPSEWRHAPEPMTVMAFTERGVYRPGDTVHVKGIVRIETDDGLGTPGDRAVTVRVHDSRGDSLHLDHLRDIRTTAFGTFAFDVPMEAGGPLGHYQVVVEIAGGGDAEARTGGTSFRVAEYKAPTFAVEATADRKEYVRGDTLRFGVKGEYLFGAPMVGADARWWVSRSDTAFVPEAEEYRDWSFGEETRWWEEPHEAPDAGVVAEGRERLGPDGGVAGEVPLAFAAMRRPAVATVEGEVSDLDRTTSASRASAIVHPATFYVGLRRSRPGLLQAGGALDMNVVALAPDGRPRPGVAVSGTLYRREWHTVRREGMGGHYDWISRPEDAEVTRCAVTTTERAATCSAPLERPGQYVFRAAAVDERGNPVATTYTAYVAGAGVAGWYRSDDNKVELVPDKAEYVPGDTAKVLIQSPFPEADALVTVERAGVLHRKVHRLAGNAPVIEIPILESYRPNVYVSVALVRGRTRERPGGGEGRNDDPGKPAFRMGLVTLAVETKSRRLAVDVTPARPEYAPGSEIDVSLSVTDAAGAGVPAEVTLFAVDEAVLRLTGYEEPDPMKVFWAPRGLSVRTSDVRLDLMSRRSYDDDKGDEGGGGAGADGTMRSDFRTAAYWNPGILTDSRGRASVRFRLPENLTTYRIMAVAVSQTDRFGRGKASVRIAKPLLMRPALPRFVRPGDAFEAGVVVTNRGGPAGEARVTVEADGARLRGGAERAVRLGTGRSAEVRFQFEAGSPGEATFRFRVRMGDLEDGLRVKRPVILPLVPETVATYGETLSRAVERLGDLDLVRSDVGGLTMTVSSSALTGLQPAIDHMLFYPHACAEQLVSRIVPLVALRELCDGLGLALPVDADKLVRGAISDLAAMQRPDGGFGFWPGAYRSDPWLTAYAAWGLLRARERGHDVPETILEEAARWLERALRTDAAASEPARLPLVTKAFIVYVLADAGEPEHGYQETLFERRGELPLIGKGFLLKAYVLSGSGCETGDCPQVVELLREIENHAFQSAGKAHFEENVGDLYRALMQSDTTANAILLDALLTADPRHHLAAGIVRWLLDKRDGGRWATTQDSAHALLALASFRRSREADPADFTATIDLGSERLMAEEFRERGAREARTEIPMDRLAEATSEEILVRRQGPSGRLYYSLLLEYARSDLPTEPIDRGFWLERRYEVVDLAAMREGRGVPRGRTQIHRVKAGDLVRVQVSIVTPQERLAVVVEDPLPAGLDAIDFDLRTATLTLQRAAAGYARGDDDPYGGYGIDDEQAYGYGYDYDRDLSGEWWWTPFYHRDDRDDRVVLYADSLPAGVHHYEYLARAVTPGTFVVGPLRAEEMYAPETFGRTGATTFVVDPP
ncbi:MAG: alpha-2-macroglobulin family protein, partial [Myxococcota bacterium]|nr:alpha-2-macroglobulin family protein [Myxococcota bacterium]